MNARALYLYLLGFAALFSMHGCGDEGAGGDEERTPECGEEGGPVCPTMPPYEGTSPPKIDCSAEGCCMQTRAEGGCEQMRCDKDANDREVGGNRKVCKYGDEDWPEDMRDGIACTIDECEAHCLEGTTQYPPYSADQPTRRDEAGYKERYTALPGPCIQWAFEPQEVIDGEVHGECYNFATCFGGVVPDDGGYTSYNPR